VARSVGQQLSQFAVAGGSWQRGGALLGPAQRSARARVGFGDRWLSEGWDWLPCSECGWVLGARAHARTTRGASIRALGSNLPDQLALHPSPSLRPAVRPRACASDGMSERRVADANQPQTSRLMWEAAKKPEFKLNLGDLIKFGRDADAKTLLMSAMFLQVCASTCALC